MKTFKDLVEMLHEAGAEITFSQWCISGLVPDCKCSRCLTSRGLPVTPETEREAEDRSLVESRAFRNKTLEFLLKTDHNCPRCADFTESNTPALVRNLVDQRELAAYVLANPDDAGARMGPTDVVAEELAIWDEAAKGK